MLRVLFTAILLASSANAQSPTDADPSAGSRSAFGAPTAFGPADTAFGYDARYSDDADRTFVSFPLNSGGFPSDTLNVLAPDGGLVQGCDFDDIDLTVMICLSASGGLFRVDLDSQAVTEIGPGSYSGQVADLTYSVVDDAWFALASSCSDVSPADDRSVLFRVDPATGAASALGTGTDVSFCGLGLAADRDGTLFAYSANTDAAVSRSAQVDPETGAFGILGPTGFDAYYAQSMDCDASDGACYAFGYVGSGVNGLFLFNPISGFLTSFGELPEGAELTAAAIATTTADVVASQSGPADPDRLRVLSATPARTSLRLGIGGPGSGDSVLEVADALGRRIARHRVRGGATLALDVSRWAPGLYLLRLVGDGVAVQQMVTVAR